MLCYLRPSCIIVLDKRSNVIETSRENRMLILRFSFMKEKKNRLRLMETEEIASRWSR